MTERTLIEGCLKKNAKSQQRLFEQFAGIMMTVCRRYACDHNEAEDILQESFIRVFASMDQFRFEGSLEGWIKRIVINTALTMIKKKKIRFSDIDEHTETGFYIDAEVVTDLDAEELLRLIAALPEGYRLVFNLYALEGYDHNEIAALLDITAGTSRSQLLKARRLLKMQIENLKQLPKKYARK